MNSKIRLSALPTAAAALLALAACAGQPPNTEINSAQAMLKQAQPVAEKEAPKEYLDAKDKLGQAIAALQAKEYAKARTLAMQAEADAKLAWTIGENARTQRAADEVNAANRALRQEMERKSQ